ncbi:TIGR03086 family metal-binding protein [Lentzea sp. BCCO 10_0856]|uniref:TIGR03086 family metal-binding protein n=1 Tax=Lentzea miocenica TaxID=3095431 RepID=A0ABU4T5E1_9PSEU|nr:TIGR03086 family metal-binding protein [Lentzea sp. BCCO 10_0856]MDX8033391.1 TIGR03086 family metal-binding protein [Lentzea sp. BCCO 10_0856]
MPINDLLAHHRAAVLASVAVVAQVQAADLGRPTPCAEWTLADLLAHMTAQHHGFAAAARGRGGEHAAWEVRPATVAGYTAAAEDVLAAFAEPEVPQREFELPEFRPVSRFPAAQAISFHLIDYVVHGWDVARSLGLDHHLAPDLAGPALRIALAVPDGDNRLEPGAAFGPALAVDDDADPLHRILALLGRSPEWTGYAASAGPSSNPPSSTNSDPVANAASSEAR